MENIGDDGVYHDWGTQFNHSIWKFVEANDLDIDEGNRRCCEACMLPIFSTPYKINVEGYFLHRCCTNLLLNLTEHPLHPGQLLLHQQSSTLVPHQIGCNGCKREVKGFFYQCPDKNCRYTLDVLCAAAPIRIVHRSHRHELVPVRSKSNLFTCGACGLKSEGEFYGCKVGHFCDACDFYIHRDCASLPNTIQYSKHEQHPLSLTYALPDNSFIFQNSKTCSICYEELSSLGMYFCLSCNYNAHIKCIISEPTRYKSESSQNIISGLVHLPMPDERTSLVRYLLDRKIDHSSNSSSIDATKEEKKLLRKEIHSHSLILIDDEYGDGPFDQLCNACIQPISSPYYTCTEPRCNNIYFHNYCTNLPLQLYHHPAHKRYSETHSKDCGDDRPLRLLPRLSSNFYYMFMCDSCRQFCNGFVYRCDECLFKMDVSCALLPEVMTYEGHGKSHILFLSLTKSTDEYRVCNCCGGYTSLFKFYYDCCSCPNLELHPRCALLPSSVSHKFDRHPLKLTFPEFSTPKDDDRDFCEICENHSLDRPALVRQGWFYHCEECATSFHVDCIPCVAPLSKIKFGETICVPRHDCPLSSIRTLTSYNYECGVCKTIIKGQKIEWRWSDPRGWIAFECVKCCFWLCWPCAVKEWVKEE